MQLANLKRLLILTAIASATLGVSSCPGNAPEFRWNPKIYAGDARTQSLVRKQGNTYQRIRCSESQFDTMVCMHNSEIRKAREAYFEVINQCERWKSGAANTAAMQGMDWTYQLDTYPTE